MSSAKYSAILFRNVRTETPSRCADAVRLPWVLASVSKTKSRSTSRMGEPTSHRARRRRDAVPLRYSTLQCPPCPSSGDNKKVNDFLTRSIRHEDGSAAGLNVSKLIL
jgi:hypothetical protein